MRGETTLQDVLNLGALQPGVAIAIEWLIAKDFEHRYRLIHRAVDYAVRKMVMTPQHYQGFGEDELTNVLMSFLDGMGLNPIHDAQVGGHCDIVVQAHDGFLWIGESKIHSSYDWLLKGFNQLDTRYSTGMPGQNSGDLIIFIYQPRIDLIMTRWVKHLQEERADISFQDPQADNINRTSSHTHNRSGLPFSVRHVPVSLYFQPKDSE